MKISVILAHPKKGSFNHAIAERALLTLEKLGHEVIFHDLYKEGFNPLLFSEEIKSLERAEPLTIKHCREIGEAEGIIIIHPNWWGQPPAILKGWVDRVIRKGVAYRFEEGNKGEGLPKGLLKAKKALVFNTADTPEERELNHFGDPLQTLWEKCIFDFCGVKNFRRKTFSVIVTSTIKQRNEWLSEVEEITKQNFAY